MQRSWSPASQKKTLDLFCCSIQGGKSNRNCPVLQLHRSPNASVCEQGEACACACVHTVWERGNQRQVSDVSGVNLYGMVAAVLPAEQSGGSGGERSDTKPERDHIVVCQTSAFLANPHTESLIIPTCCSPSLCLSLSLMLIHPPPIPRQAKTKTLSIETKSGPGPQCIQTKARPRSRQYETNWRTDQRQSATAWYTYA